jgi:hypothetical protein
MKTIKLSILALTAFVLSVTTSCNKHKHDDENETGTAQVHFEHVWGMSETAFSLNTNLVHPMTGDTMNFTKFKYYVSNLKLKKADGTWWIHPESYFLVDASDAASTTLSLGTLPVGEYTEMEYTLGVDSTRNVSGAQAGALSTTNGMFWSWNTGYIMIKAEGTSPQSSTGNFAFHLGGFSGTKNIVTVKNVVFGAENLVISKDNTSEVHMKCNPAKLFHADPLSSGTSVMMPGSKAQSMATNFYGSFVFEHVHN